MRTRCTNLIREAPLPRTRGRGGLTGQTLRIGSSPRRLKPAATGSARDLIEARPEFLDSEWTGGGEGMGVVPGEATAEGSIQTRGRTAAVGRRPDRFRSQ